MYLYILVNVFGKYTYIAAQIINVFMLIIAFYSIYKIIKTLYRDDEVSNWVWISLCAFIPISLYVTFVYGNIPGFACSMAAVMFEILYIEKAKKRYIVPMTILICLAVLFKSNYLITLIAMLIVLLTEAIFKRRFNLLITVCIITIAYLLSGNTINFIGKHMTGKELDKGTPMKSYIAMGLQEGTREAGWYNGYTQEIYKKQGYDYNKANEAIDKDIAKSMEKFRKDAGYTINFFGRKITSQWNNPTFQCFWVNTMRKSDKPKSKIVKSVTSSNRRINKILRHGLNIMQTLILFGALAYLILDYRNIEIKKLTFAIIFIGGFLFHLIWEAKCQYTVTYFILLIPYSVLGYKKICENFVNFYIIKIKKLKYIESKDIINETK